MLRSVNDWWRKLVDCFHPFISFISVLFSFCFLSFRFVSFLFLSSSFPFPLSWFFAFLFIPENCTLVLFQLLWKNVLIRTIWMASWHSLSVNNRSKRNSFNEHYFTDFTVALQIMKTKYERHNYVLFANIRRQQEMLIPPIQIYIYIYIN